MSIVLRHQVEASERSADELAGHRDAMLCQDIEDHLENLVDLRAKIAHAVERWQARPQGTANQTNEPTAAEWEELYQRVERVFTRTPQLITWAEQAGFDVKGKQAFYASWRQLRGVTSFSKDRVAAAAEQIRNGESRPLDEVMHELWDRPVR